MQTNSKIYELIKDFYNDARVIELQNYYNSLSFIEILGVARNEKAHSSFLAWLFNSNANYGLGTKPLELLLELIVKEKGDKPFPESINKDDVLIRSLDISQPENVRTEYPIKKGKKGSIDIYIPFTIKDKQYALIIENKVKASENKIQIDGESYMQTDKYFEYFNKIANQNTEYIYVFLAPERDGKLAPANNKNFINISYSMVVKNIITPLLLNNKIDEKVKLFLNDYLKILNKPNSDDPNNSELVLAISEYENTLTTEIANKHKDLGNLLMTDNNLTEEEIGILHGFKEFNLTILLSVWPDLKSKNRKNRTFAELGIVRGSILYLAKSATSDEPDKRNIEVRTIDDINTIEYIVDGKSITGPISPAARELAQKKYGLNGFEWFIYEGCNLIKIKQVDKIENIQ